MTGTSRCSPRRSGPDHLQRVSNGVGLLPAMVHGGPFPATSDGKATSVGISPSNVLQPPVCFQDAPPEILPSELEDKNPFGIWRLVDGQRTRA